MVEMTTETIIAGIGMIGSGALSFGVVKGMMANKVGYDDHRKMCDEKQQVNNNKIDSVINRQTEIYGMVKEIHGYIKRSGGNI